MQFGNITSPNRQWDQEVIVDILMACLVLHNMTIEDEYNLNLEPSFDVRENITFKGDFHLRIMLQTTLKLKIMILITIFEMIS
jgi:hypothetical protein